MPAEPHATPPAVRLAARVYALVLYAVPGRFRQRFGLEARAFFEELACTAWRDGGIRGVVLVLVRSIRDVVQRSPVEHAAARRQPTAVPRFPLREALMDALTTDFRHAVRGLLVRPGFTVLVAVILAATLAANSAVFSVVDALLLRSLPYPDADRLVMIANAYPTLGVTRGNQNPRDFMNYREMTESFDAIEAIGEAREITLTGRGDARRVSIVSLTHGLLPLLGVEPELGRGFDDDDDETVALVSHAFWQSELGGDEAALGQTLVVNNQAKTVIGVLPRGFRLHLPGRVRFSPDTAIWYPATQFFGEAGNWDATAHWLKTVARVRPDRSIAQAQAELNAVAAYQHEDQPRKGERQSEIVAVPFHAEVVRPFRPILTTLFGAVAVLLLIACANVANLMIVRGQARGSEMALRTACGASRGRLVRLLATEGFVLGLIGVTVGGLAAPLLLSGLMALAPGDLPYAESIGINVRVMTFAMGATLLAVFLFAVLPALTASHDRVGSLGGRSVARGGLSRFDVRGMLVVAEVALTLILLIGGGLLVRSFMALADQPTGFQTENVLSFVAAPPRTLFENAPARAQGWNVSPINQRYYRELNEAFATVAGVEAVATIWPTPLAGGASGSTYASEENPEAQEDQRASSLLVTPGYFDTVGIPVVAGRAFDWEDDGDKLMVDETLAARLWPGESPLGKRLVVSWWSGDQWGEVIGVTAQVRSLSLTEDDPPTIYRLAAAFAYAPQTFVVRASGDARALVGPLRERLRERYPEVPMANVELLSTYVDQQLTTVRFAMTLIVIFAALGMLIAVVGLYGVVAYAVNQRTREIGIRMALGAERSRVVAMVLRQALLMAGVGIALGALAARWLTQLLGSLLYGVGATDALTFVLLATGLAMVAVVACWLPAARASRVDPALSLRAE